VSRGCPAAEQAKREWMRIRQGRPCLSASSATGRGHRLGEAAREPLGVVGTGLEARHDDRLPGRRAIESAKRVEGASADGAAGAPRGGRLVADGERRRVGNLGK